MKPPSAHPTRRAVVAAIAGLTAFAATNLAQAESSDLSEASLVPVALSVALPVASIAAVGSLVVLAVEGTVDGIVWIVETAADGIKGSIRFAARAAGAVSVAVGTVIVVTAVATGVLLSAAGHVIAFVPNEIGNTLTYNQRVSQ